MCDCEQLFFGESATLIFMSSAMVIRNPLHPVRPIEFESCSRAFEVAPTFVADSIEPAPQVFI